ncbi:hypothetical protein [Gordonia sesuvii]|uniref:hypothetical protein n=1 Tax=Gordonia sesuvii TaxID=3116777 RepID=UPI002ED4BFDB
MTETPRHLAPRLRSTSGRGPSDLAHAVTAVVRSLSPIAAVPVPGPPHPENAP